MSPMVAQVSKSEFEAKALELFQRIEATGEPLIIIGNGQPCLEVRRLDEPKIARSVEEVLKALGGMILRYDDPFEPVGVDDWEALK
jgi:hypothetical protein